MKQTTPSHISRRKIAPRLGVRRFDQAKRNFCARSGSEHAHGVRIELYLVPL